MFVIRKKHLEAFEKSATERFEGDALAFLRDAFPAHWAYAGEPKMRELVALGLQEARSHRLSTERNVCHYLSFMCLLGSGFDADPQYPWAAAILDDPATTAEDVRMDQLLGKVKKYLKHWAEDFAGADAESSRLLTAIHQLRHDPELPLFQAELQPVLVRRLQELFPKKCAFLGEAAV